MAKYNASGQTTHNYIKKGKMWWKAIKRKYA